MNNAERQEHIADSHETARRVHFEHELKNARLDVVQGLNYEWWKAYLEGLEAVERLLSKSGKNPTARLRGFLEGIREGKKILYD